MKHVSLLIVLAFFTFGTIFSANLPIIPQPISVKTLNGSFNLSQITEIKSGELSGKSINQMADYLSISGMKIFGRIMTAQKNAVLTLKIDKTDPTLPTDEAYRLTVEPSHITAAARTETGLFYAVQTLRQLTDSYAATGSIPCIEIVDYPRFMYRGMHLDVSRHFFGVDFVKKQLDMMAYYKLNTFHWHFTDGPGWRLEIKKYPLLTQVAAWRTDETWKDWWATQPRKYVNMRSGEKRFGGFYTQQQAREIVRYAAERHITVIPEIEMPGHSEEVLAVYPHLACTGKPYTQSEFCIGNEQTFVFLQNVLKEVMAIFPSEYIHIGGDEADKSHWKKCPKCQARMKKEGLKNEDELQSYLIRRIEKFLIKNKRKLLGWDEILEGGLAPEATVMSWRGESGGIQAVKSGHNAVMTPGEFMYLDSYQANPATQPEAIGGFLPIEKVYSYNPVPENLTPDEAKHILGVQSNLWAEYIPTEKHAEYMLYPRVLAMAEVAWTEPRNKHWNDFKRRVNQAIPYLQKQGINTFTLSDEVAFGHDLDSAERAVAVTLSTEKYGKDIRYTLNGSAPTFQSAVYKCPLLIKDSANVAAQLFDGENPVGKPVYNRFDYHLGIGKKVMYNLPVNKYYPAGGENALVDGRKGGLSHGDGRWQGFMTAGMDVTIDLGKSVSLRTIQARFMQSIGPWIYFPKEVVVSVSDDNVNFTELKRISTTMDEKAAGTLFQTFGWQGVATGRYIRYQALPNGIKGGWVFLDEIVVW